MFNSWEFFTDDLLWTWSRLTSLAGCSPRPPAGWDFVAPIAAPQPQRFGGFYCNSHHNHHASEVSCHRHYCNSHHSHINHHYYFCNRRNNDGEPVCNACGLYYKLHGVNRFLADDQKLDKDRIVEHLWWVAWLFSACYLLVITQAAGDA